MSSNSLKIIHRSNYIVYIDDVRVDQFLVNWNSSIGLSANEANASLVFFRAPAMDKWKAYLSKVKIFAENPFTKKYSMVFEGDIISRSWGERKSNMGTVVFHCSGFYHWLEVKIPMAINTTDEMNPLQRFIYEAQNIDIEKVRSIVTSDSEVLLKDNNVQGVIDQLFEKVTVGYYEAAGDNTNFGFSKIKDRFAILSDVKKEFRESGFLDLFTFSKASYIDSFSAYLVEVIEQLMMEFYQDRDGTMKIKFPAWGDDVLKSHILDASIIESISGVDNWSVEPTRVLAVGSATQLQQALNGNSMGGNIMFDLTIPVGLYIGNPRDPDTEDYYSTTFDYVNQGGDGGADGDYASTGYAEESDIRGDAISTPGWFDNLPNFRITSGHKSVNASRPSHLGTDYGTRYGTIHSIGTHGTVVENGPKHGSMGWNVTIGQNIDGKYYEFKYMHFSSKSALRVGDKIAPGQVVGQSGETGNAQGPHLHLEIWEGVFYKGRNLNPEAFLQQKRRQFSGQPKHVPGSGGGGSTSSSSPRVASGSRYIDPNTISSWEKGKAFLDVNVSKEADENVTLNNNVSAATLNGMLGGKVANTGHSYIKYGNKYGIDPAFGVAISMQETGYGKSISKNNVAGLMNPASNWTSLISFPTIDAGIEAFFRNLNNLYISKGRITPRTIQATYAPKGAGNDPRQLNRNWLPNIVSIWNKLRGNSSSTPTAFSPYATTEGGGGGLSLVNYANSFTRSIDRINRARYESYQGIKIETPLAYNDNLIAKSMPGASLTMMSTVNAQLGKLSPGLIAAIINSTTSWSQRYSSARNVGIMDTPKSLLEPEEYEMMKYASYAIPRAVGMIVDARKRFFDGQIVPAIAGYFNGNFNTMASNFTGYKKDYQKIAKAYAGSEHIKKTEKVIDNFLMNQGGYSYINGQIHKDFTGSYFNIGGSVKVMNEDGVLEEYTGERHQFLTADQEEAEEAFQAKLSEEEKMYKINLVQVEQELIRMDSKALSSDVLDGSSEIDMDGSTPNDDSVLHGPWPPTGPLGNLKDQSQNNSVGKLNNPMNNFNGHLNSMLDKKPGSDYKPSIYPGMLGQMKGKSIQNSDFPTDFVGSYTTERVASNSTMKISSPYTRAEKMLNEQVSVPINAEPTSMNQNMDVLVGPQEMKTEHLADLMDLKVETVTDYSAEIDELIYQYAKYNMQLHRAMAHDVSVELGLCLPQLRVGFNMWLEPTRTDVVFYATRISHSGSFGSGCKTNVSGAFVRSTKDYKFVSDNVFIGDRHADSGDFGDVAKPNELQGIRDDLNALHTKGGSLEAHKITPLTKLYGSQDKDNEYSSKWNSEKTPEEIEKMVNEEYSSAPEVIVAKKKQTREVINESVETFVEKLHAYAMKGG